MFEQYEYRTMEADRMPSAEDLNELGGEGWELVTLIEGNPADNNAGKLIVYLKREKRRDKSSQF